MKVFLFNKVFPAFKKNFKKNKLGFKNKASLWEKVKVPLYIYLKSYTPSLVSMTSILSIIPVISIVPVTSIVSIVLFSPDSLSQETQEYSQNLQMDSPSQNQRGGLPFVVRENNAAVELLEKALEEQAKVEAEESVFHSAFKPLWNFYEKLKRFFVSEKKEVIQKLPPKNPQAPQEEDDLSPLARTEAYSAYRHLLNAIERESFDPRLYLNLGLAFEFNGEWEKSFLAYENAQKYSGEDPKINFLSLYNAARIRGHQKKIPEALRLYQGALEIWPDSVEVKTNIELLTAMSAQQQSGGNGKGDGNPNKDKEGSQSDQIKEDGPIQNGREIPSSFQSRELSEDDVRRILEEIKNQEQKIRAKENKKAKERPRAKDW